MSDSTTYINFSAIDYTGNDSLSTYTLGITPLKFVADLPNNYNYRLVWDFGDDTFSKSFSPSKVYEFPGRYISKLVVYDCNSNAMISTFEKIITVYDYIPYTFNIQLLGYIIDESGNYMLSETGDYITTDITDLKFKCGKIDGPLSINAYYPPYQTPSSIYYSISGSNSFNYWDISNEKFSHLENFNTLYDKVYNYSISSFQYREIDKIDFTPVGLYCKIENDEVVSCSSSDVGAVFAGMSANSSIYFKDDSISDLVLVDFWFDKNASSVPNRLVDGLNNLSITLSCKVVDNIPTSLSLTSNGLDGEGYAVNSFIVSPIKYFNTQIPFVVKIKDFDHMSVKNYNTIDISSLVFTVSSMDGGVELTPSTYSISSLNYTLSSQGMGGAFRGYIEFPYNGVDILEDVSINVAGTFTNDQSLSYQLSGASNNFNVYSQNYYDLWKIHEDFNPKQTLMDLRFQETMLDKTILFEDFFKQLLGDDTSDHEAIGIKMYEKIANFVQNTQDIDNCEQEFIDSLAQFMGYNDNGEERYQYPETIKRLINLSSVDKSRLIGTLNKFRENLDIKGRTSKTEYGINIGNKIDTSTYTVSAGIPIVALEKFSNDYVLLNTYQPISAVGSTTFPLLDYTSDWGWPLVLPTQFNTSDFEKYYSFFEYNDQYDNTAIGGIIDFENPRTTISSTVTTNELFSDSGIFTNLFLDTLYQSLSLVK